MTEGYLVRFMIEIMGIQEYIVQCRVTLHQTITQIWREMLLDEGYKDKAVEDRELIEKIVVFAMESAKTDREDFVRCGQACYYLGNKFNESMLKAKAEEQAAHELELDAAMRSSFSKIIAQDFGLLQQR